jgi:hypothetical protein
MMGDTRERSRLDRLQFFTLPLVRMKDFRRSTLLLGHSRALSQIEKTLLAT